MFTNITSTWDKILLLKYHHWKERKGERKRERERERENE